MIPAPERSRLPVAFLIGICIVIVCVVGAVVYSKYAGPTDPTVVEPLPMGPKEVAYAPEIHFLDPKMSRAANFLNQEVTFVFGSVQNSGKRKVKQIEILLEFHDPFKQVVLRDTQRLFLPNANPMQPGEQRDFQIGYEHLSAQWDNGYPSISITGLELK